MGYESRKRSRIVAVRGEMSDREFAEAVYNHLSKLGDSNRTRILNAIKRASESGQLENAKWCALRIEASHESDCPALLDGTCNCIPDLRLMGITKMAQRNSFVEILEEHEVLRVD